MIKSTASERIVLIDNARFYGIFLVYYGHMVAKMMQYHDAAHYQYKFIYSFHMILFFVLSGYISKESDLKLSIGKYLQYHSLNKILPFLFFNLILIFLTFFISGDFDVPNNYIPGARGYLYVLLLTICGWPVFNLPTWFLLCLFAVYMVHYVAFRYLTSDRKILIGGVIFYITGYVVNWKFLIFNPLLSLYWNYFYIHEALIIYPFFLLGIYLRNKQCLTQEISPVILTCGLGITWFILFATFNLNKGPFRLPFPFDVVVIEFSEHGNFFFFPITAIAGTFFVLFLSKITPTMKVISVIGQNTLILLGLNGVFYHFINARIAEWGMFHLPYSPASVFLTCTFVAIVSLIFCYPMMVLFNKYIPQVVGKPKIKGPLFNNFI